LKLNSLCSFLTKESSKKELVFQYCIEQYASEHQIIMKDFSLDKLIEVVYPKE